MMFSIWVMEFLLLHVKYHLNLFLEMKGIFHIFEMDIMTLMYVLMGELLSCSLATYKVLYLRT